MIYRITPRCHLSILPVDFIHLFMVIYLLQDDFFNANSKSSPWFGDPSWSRLSLYPPKTYPRFLSPRNHGLFCWDESRYLDKTCGKKGGLILYSILCSIMFYHVLFYILSSPGWVYIPEFFAGFAPKFLVLRLLKRTDTYGGLPQHRCIGVFGIELLRRSSNYRGKSMSKKVPSGKLSHNYGKSPFLIGKINELNGPCSIAFCML